MAFIQDAACQPVPPPPGERAGQLYFIQNATGRKVYGFHFNAESPADSSDLEKAREMQKLVLRLIDSEEIKVCLTEGQLFLFNATDHERAMETLIDGIKPYKQLGPVEFGDGFYLGRHLLSILQHSLEWYRHSPALLVYACSKEQLCEPLVGPKPGETEPVHVLDFYESGEQSWQQCIKYLGSNRSSYVEIDSDLKKRLNSNSLDIIRGPWSEGPLKMNGGFEGYRPDPLANYDADRRAAATYISVGFTDNNEQILINYHKPNIRERMDSFLLLAVFWPPAPAPDTR